MTREQHNRFYGVNRQANEIVSCNVVGRDYGDLAQYDSACAACWLGHSHTWAQHDLNLACMDAMRTRDTLRLKAQARERAEKIRKARG